MSKFAKKLSAPCAFSRVRGRGRHVRFFFGCLFFLLLFPPRSALCKVYFHSDFERGETCIAEDLSPDQHSIRLLPNFRLDEWPQEGGQGIVEGNLAAAADTFTYVIRSGPVLKGVRGISRKHPKWADIRTGDLMEWQKSAESGSRESSGKIAVTGHNPLFGNYSACIKMDFISKISMGREPPDGAQTLFVRFYVLFSGDLVRTTSEPWRIFELRSFLRHLPDMLISPSTKNGPFFDLETDSLMFHREAFPDNRIHLETGRKYCVEYQVAFTDTQQALVSLFVNQTLQLRETWKPGFIGSNAMGFNPTLPSYPGAGEFFVDEFVCSDSAIGPLPGKPVLKTAGNSIRVSPIAEESGVPSLFTAHWQANGANSWLLPLFNGGKTSDTTLSAFSLAGLLSGDTVRVPTEKGREYFTRLRCKNDAGNWSEWSTPVLFRPQPGPPAPDSLRPVIRKVFFTRPGSRSPLKSISAGTEYDLYVYPHDPGGWSILSYCDVYLYTPPEEDEGNYANRGGEFKSGNTCMISYSIWDGNLFEKHNQRSDVWSRLFAKTGAYVNDSGNGYAENRKQGWARARIRIPDDTRPGPMLIKAFAANSRWLVSPMHRQLIPVAGPAESGNDAGGFSWLALLAVGTVCLLAGGLAIRFLRPGPRIKAPQDPKEQESKIGLLEFDSPYDENVKRARDFILNNYMNDISAKDVAENAGVSLNWLSTFFRKATQKKVSSYINEVRIDNAKKLLVETKLNIREIAFKTGFNGAEQFYQVFRKITGQAASEYREANKKATDDG